MTASRKEQLAIAITAVVGAAIWLAISIASGRIEAWDSDLFFTVGVPLMMLTSCIAAFILPQRPMPFGFSTVILQPLVMIVRAGEIGSMFPMGLVMFGIVGAIVGVPALIAAEVKKKFFASQRD